MHDGRTARRVAILVAALALAASACITPEATDPSVPKGLRTTLTAGGFAVSWTPVSGASRYVVQYGVVDSPAPPPTVISTTDPHADVGGLVTRHRYRFVVRAEVGGVLRGWSSSVTVPFVVPVLPVIRIDTAGHAPIISKEQYLTGTFELDAPGSPAVASTMQIRGRGNSTWAADKKPYRLKLDTSTSLLGIHKSKNWVLLADRFDSTHLRNTVGFDLGRETGLAWTPETRQVELVLNGSYEGVYELSEHIRVDSSRVDIDEMGPEDLSGDALTGGYLAQVDPGVITDGDPGFLTPRNNPIVIEDPDPAAPQQYTYFRNYVASFENALYSPHFAGPSTGYAAYLDVPSMVDLYLVNELVRNQDAFLGSTYFSKPRLGKITMGPLWDLDNSLGNVRGWDTGSPTGWFVRRDGLKWISRLFQDPAFSAAVAARWDQLRPAFSAMPAQIVQEGAALAPAMANEAARWTYRPAPVATPEQLADWLQARIDWIDANIHSSPTSP
jgi:hypothetical protein